jgi:cell division protein FtsL
MRPSKQHSSTLNLVVRILLIGIFLSGCSMRRVVLDHHEFFATQAASRFFDLDHNQKNEFRDIWRRFSSKVAHSKVDEIAIQVEALGQTTSPLLQIEKLSQLTSDLSVEGCDAAAPLLAGLQPDQILHLKEKLQDRNRKFTPEKNGGLEKYRKSVKKRSFENVTQWLGRINNRQRDAIEQTEREKDIHGHWERDYLAYSNEAQSKVIELLANERRPPETVRETCKKLVKDPDSILSLESKKHKSALAASRQRTLESIFSLMEPDQREHLKKETAKLAADLRNWALQVRQQ